MDIKIAHTFIIFLLSGVAAFFQRCHGKSWWLLALISALFLVVWLDAVDESVKGAGKPAVSRLRQACRISAVVFMAALGIYDGYHGQSWWFTALLSLMLLFFWWTAGLPDGEPGELEPAYNPGKLPSLPFEDAVLSGSDADFTYYTNERFPWADWKDPAEETLALFLPHVPGLKFDVLRSPPQISVTLEWGVKSQTIILEVGPQAAQLIEALADFMAPEFILCSYRFTEGSDTWINPVFTAELWERLKSERPDRARLFTPLIEHRTLTRGPLRK